jgi:hypothetical protein
MTVLLMRDLLASARPGTDRGPATFYFAHSETLLPLLAQLGIARDQVGGTGHTAILAQPPLSAQHMPEDRLWRTSLIGGEQTDGGDSAQGRELTWPWSPWTVAVNGGSSFTSTNDQWTWLAAQAAAAMRQTLYNIMRKRRVRTSSKSARFLLPFQKRHNRLYRVYH